MYRRNGESAFLSGIRVSGFKSLFKSAVATVSKLTVLAGANSAGKSTIFQPLLLLKQTLESSFDPGPILLNGPNVKFTSVDQMLSRSPYATGVESAKTITIAIKIGGSDLTEIEWQYAVKPKKSIDLVEMNLKTADRTLRLATDLTHADLKQRLTAGLINELFTIGPGKTYLDQPGASVSVERTRCFLDATLTIQRAEGALTYGSILKVQPFWTGGAILQDIIHIPGLRGNPSRTYPVTAVGSRFQGSFNSYVASVISDWQTNDKERLHALAEDLEALGLTWKVAADPINDTEVELRVGRLPHPKRAGARDLVNIADVGFGLSQTLPVVVALHAAQPGHTVYIEQPEIHLHPKAQTVMASVLLNAVKRGVRVVAETHSTLMLLGLQTLVAKGDLDPADLSLHWLSRDSVGSTTVSTAEVDSNGAFGDWPEDFADVVLSAQEEYLKAVSFGVSP